MDVASWDGNMICFISNRQCGVCYHTIQGLRGFLILLLFFPMPSIPSRSVFSDISLAVIITLSLESVSARVFWLTIVKALAPLHVP